MASIVTLCMRIACLVSGGKDSLYACYLAKQHHEIVCFLSMKSKNPDSYMFHTPNTHLTELQAEAAGIPILIGETVGEKEEELKDLRRLLLRAKELGAEGVVTGAIESVYQASRIQRICLDLGLWCFNPLWQHSQERLLEELLDEGFEIIISSVAAEPFGEEWLGRSLDRKAVKELLALRDKHGINPAGEGGEFETFVTNCPLFKGRIKIAKAKKEYKNYAGRFLIEEASL